MKLVVDTNTIISALVKDSMSREIFNNLNYQFLAPDFSLQEIKKYKSLICKKADIDELTFEILLGILFNRIDIVPLTEYQDSINEAESLIGKSDKKDVPFLALAIAKKSDGIWSDDKHFEKQNKIKIFKTKDLLS